MLIGGEAHDQAVQTDENEDIEILFQLYEENFTDLIRITEKGERSQSSMGVAQLVYQLSEITNELRELMPYEQALPRLLKIINGPDYVWDENLVKEKKECAVDEH